jgi:hypothetical protein
MDWIETRRPFPSHVAYIEKRYATEPFRLILSLLANDLAEASRDDMKTHLLGQYPHQARLTKKTLLEPLELMASALPEALVEDELKIALQKMRDG